jgi:acid phosphatase (class A)
MLLRPVLRRSIALFTILFLTAAVALAEPPKSQPKYLAPNAIDVTALLPDPPAADSPEHEAEMQQLLKLEKDRTPAEVARCNQEEHMTIFLFADAVGSKDFSEANCPKLAEFFKTTLQPDLGYFSKAAKEHFNRPRPYTDSLIHALFSEKNASYPSGHSTRATMWGEILSALLPERREQIVARSQQMGWDREIAGVHYPTDVFAGRVLGKALAKALLADPEVQAQLQALKPELEKALMQPAK